jgi:hypothetical protein
MNAGHYFKSFPAAYNVDSINVADWTSNGAFVYGSDSNKRPQLWKYNYSINRWAEIQLDEKITRLKQVNVIKLAVGKLLFVGWEESTNEYQFRTYNVVENKMVYLSRIAGPVSGKQLNVGEILLYDEISRVIFYSREKLNSTDYEIRTINISGSKPLVSKFADVPSDFATKIGLGSLGSLSANAHIYNEKMYFFICTYCLASKQTHFVIRCIDLRTKGWTLVTHIDNRRYTFGKCFIDYQTSCCEQHVYLTGGNFQDNDGTVVANNSIWYINLKSDICFEFEDKLSGMRLLNVLYVTEEEEIFARCDSGLVLFCLKQFTPRSLVNICWDYVVKFPRLKPIVDFTETERRQQLRLPKKFLERFTSLL